MLTGAYTAPPHISLSWQPLQFMSKVPMVQAGLCIEEIAEDVLQPLQEQQEGGAGGGSSVTASGDDGSLLASHDTGLFKLCTGDDIMMEMIHGFLVSSILMIFTMKRKGYFRCFRCCFLL